MDDVRDKKINVTLLELEEETSYIDAVKVFLNGTPLIPEKETSSKLLSKDQSYYILEEGEEVKITYFAQNVPDEQVEIEICVSGYYVPYVNYQ